MTQFTIQDAKSQAKALRQALQADGNPVSHSHALELVARQHGARDWNTLHARLTRQNAPPEFAIGDPVSGQYLGQAFSGRVHALSGPTHLRQIEIQLDHPVDTVRFDSFSNWRHRIRGTLGEDGQSPRKTSDGVPQLVVMRA